MFNQAKVQLGNGTINWTSASIKAMIVVDGATIPTVDIATMALVISGGATEATGGTYVRKTLANKADIVDNVGNLARYDADDVIWTALAFTNGTVVGKTKGVVIYFDPTGASADSACIPLAWLDFVVQTNGGDVTMQFSTSPSAVFTIT